MIYDFEDTKTGDLIGINYPMGKAPAIGRTVRYQGRVVRRVPSAPRVQDNTREFVSQSLPRWYKGAKRHTKDGKPIFTNKAQVADTVSWAKHNDSTPDGDLIYD